MGEGTLVLSPNRYGPFNMWHVWGRSHLSRFALQNVTVGPSPNVPKEPSPMELFVFDVGGFGDVFDAMGELV
jgi:hypothetical protein